LRRLLEQQGKQCRIASAGIYALVGHAAAPYSIEVSAEHGLNIAQHRARQLTSTMLAEHELILVMEANQIPLVLDIAPFARGRVHCVGKWLEQDVSDPYRKPREAFEKTYDLIEKSVEEWVEKL
jgi:protein-tyrosine phosphatase